MCLHTSQVFRLSANSSLLTCSQCLPVTLVLTFGIASRYSKSHCIHPNAYHSYSKLYCIRLLMPITILGDLATCHLKYLKLVLFSLAWGREGQGLTVQLKLA